MYEDPMFILRLIRMHVKAKEDEVRQEIGEENLDRLFTGKKAIPGFSAFFQTCASKVTFAGPVASDITSLGLAYFGDLQAYVPTFEKINLALQQRTTAP